MKKPATISFGLHAALLLATLVILPAPKPFEVPPVQSIQVDISTISNKTKQMAMTKDAPPTPAPPAPKVTKIEKDVPPASKVADEVKMAAHEPVKPPDPAPPDPKPLTELLKKIDPPKPVEPTPVADDPLKKLLAEQQAAEDQKKLDEQKKAEADKKKAELKKKADDKKKREQLLAEAEAALLNKIKGENTAPAKPSTAQGAPKQAIKDTAGNDDAMTATIVDALRSQLKSCFSTPPGTKELEIVVPVHFALNQDGTVNGRPESQGGDAQQEAVGNAAVAAIMTCQPFKLPVENYDLWKDNTLDFNSKDGSGT